MKVCENKGDNQHQMRKMQSDTTMELRKSNRNTTAKEKSDPIKKESDIPTNIKFKELVAQISDSNPELQLPALQSIRSILYSDRESIDVFIEVGVLPVLVRCLKEHNNPSLQYEAAWALTNIASGNSAQTNKVVEVGVMPLLLELLKSSEMNVCEQSLWVLGNIIGDGPSLRNHAIDMGVVDPVLSLITPETPITLLQRITWIILNLTRTEAPATHVIRKLIPVLNNLIDQSDVTILIDVGWTLSWLIDCGDIEKIQMLIDSGIVSKLVPLLSHKDVQVQAAALRAVGNILRGSDIQTQVVLNCNILSYLSVLVSHPNNDIRKEVMWLLSNITAGNQAQIQAVFNADLLPEIIENLRKGEFEIQKETAWIISNLTIGGSRQQIAQIIYAGVIPLLCNLLVHEDDEVVRTVLNCIYNMLKMAGASTKQLCMKIKKCDGLNKIKNVYNKDKMGIYSLRRDIIDGYFKENLLQRPTLVKSKRRLFTEAILKQAQAMLENGESKRSIAKKLQFSETTLRRHLRRACVVFAKNPPISEMAIAAIKNLKERGGSSLKAIKTYVGANYKVNTRKIPLLLKKYLKVAVASGALLVIKAKGLSELYKLSTSSKSPTGIAKGTNIISKRKVGITKATKTKCSPKIQKATKGQATKTKIQNLKTRPKPNCRAQKNSTKKVTLPKKKLSVNNKQKLQTLSPRRKTCNSKTSVDRILRIRRNK